MIFFRIVLNNDPILEFVKVHPRPCLWVSCEVSPTARSPRVCGCSWVTEIPTRERLDSASTQQQTNVITSNAVHATHSITESAKHIRSAFSPDGFLMMLEMTENIPFIDIIFGLFEGWWLFDDGRCHAIAPPSRWERDLQSGDFGHVEWTDGSLPENEIQMVIIAMASGPPHEHLPKPLPNVKSSEVGTDEVREVEVAKYVETYRQGFEAPSPSYEISSIDYPRGHCIVLTGATGSLGSHLMEKLIQQSDVRHVVCVNRHSSTPVATRQQQALSSRGITLSASDHSKLRFIETDTSKPQLGVSTAEYEWLTQNTTHIIHNAWPMCGKLPVKSFTAQFESLRQLINLTRDIASQRPKDFQVGLQLISSIGVVGHYPLWSNGIHVPEERMEINSVLGNGYCEAKYVCERMLDATLHRYPQHFRVMTARLGQIAGSETSGYWNPIEHLSYLVKSSQSLHILPSFEGTLSWVPVNHVAGTLKDLIMANGAPHPFYRIDNPLGQSWADMIHVLADALDIPNENIISFDRWIQQVRRPPLAVETENPAGRLVDFLDDHFLRMSCGGLLLDTTHTQEHSPTFAKQGPVSADVARKYIQAWEDVVFLHS
ncbi:uncharacterized protein N7511_002724 [Penicillium nucicola]|uniref:uncharacterized protein n=1 Tax=Penicillium nucicola TaxID=1850975 RepID=UPI0025456F34|nr:uncharacterized protein N7511_002724 [Penicillium nucicola]KAJ5770673.1 hypothetical protein N7511_002724 [Penicillium nucicola]